MLQLTNLGHSRCYSLNILWFYTFIFQAIYNFSHADALWKKVLFCYTAIIYFYAYSLLFINFMLIFLYIHTSYFPRVCVRLWILLFQCLAGFSWHQWEDLGGWMAIFMVCFRKLTVLLHVAVSAITVLCEVTKGFFCQGL